MRIVNLTPHAIVFRAINGTETTFQPEPMPARVASQPGLIDQRDDIFPGCRVAGAPTYGEVEFLPEPAPETIYLVSGMVLERLCGRSDVFAPATGPYDGAIRKDGQIVAVTRFVACRPGERL